MSKKENHGSKEEIVNLLQSIDSNDEIERLGSIEEENNQNKKSDNGIKSEEDKNNYKASEEYLTSNNNIFFKNAKIIKLCVVVVFILITIIISIGYFSKNKGTNSKKYYLDSYNEKKYEFKTIKVLSVYDSIIIRDSINNKDIRYDFRIEKGKVIVSCNNNEYVIKNIKKAKGLIVTPIGNLSEFSGTFILTTDGKLYSINLYDDSKLIVNIEDLDDSVKKQDLNFIVKNFEAGFYSEKGSTSGESILMIMDTNDGKHILTTKKNEK